MLIVETDAGIEGVGLGAHSDVARVFSAIEGEDPRSVVALYDRMLASVFKTGHSGAVFGTIGAIDMALWDIKAKAADEPLWRTLGGRDRFVPGYASGLEFGLEDDELAALYDRFAARGFRAGKLKGGINLDRDIPRLEIMRASLARNTRHPAVMLDVNEAWNHAQAARYLAALEGRMDLTWIEEPLRRWDARGMASLRSKVRAAIATGENLTGLEQYAPLLDAGAVDIVQAGTVWGVTHFMRVSTLAHGHDLPVSTVAYNANPIAHAATAVPNFLTHEVQDLAFPIGLDVDQELQDGGIVLGDRPGIGITVDEEALAASVAAPVAAPASGPHVRPGRAGLRMVAEPDAPEESPRPRAGARR